MLQIIPAPAGAMIVTGPYCSDSDSDIYIEPAAFLALVEYEDGNREVIPCGFPDRDAAEIHQSAVLHFNFDSANADKECRIKMQKKAATDKFKSECLEKLNIQPNEE